MKNKFFLGLLLCALITPLKADDPSQNESANNKEKAAIQDTVDQLNQLTKEYKKIKEENDDTKKNEIITKAIPLLTGYDTSGKKIDGLTVLKKTDEQYTQAAKNFTQTVGGSVLDPIHKTFDALKEKIDPNSPGAKNLKAIAEDAKTESFGNSMYYHMMMQGGKHSLSTGNAKSRIEQRLIDDGLLKPQEKEMTREEQIQQLKEGRTKEEILADGGTQDDMGRKYNKKFEEDEKEEKKSSKSTDEDESSDLKPLFEDKEVSSEISKEERIAIPDSLEPTNQNSNHTQIEEDANILGLSIRDLSDPKKVNTAYRTLSLKYHPDKGGDKEKFNSLQEAYERCKNIKPPAGLFEKDHQDQNKEPLSLENESLPLKDQEDEKKEEDNPYDGVKELFQESIPESTKKTTAEIGVGTDGLTNTDESSVGKENQRDFIPAKKTRESQLKRRNTL